MFVLCFFFFKPKTAYEMRISDWSSDVCSSDLAPALLTRGDLKQKGRDLLHRGLAAQKDHPVLCGDQLHVPHVEQPVLHLGKARDEFAQKLDRKLTEPDPVHRLRPEGKIGRAHV